MTLLLVAVVAMKEPSKSLLSNCCCSSTIPPPRALENPIKGIKLPSFSSFKDHHHIFLVLTHTYKQTKRVLVKMKLRRKKKEEKDRGILIRLNEWGEKIWSWLQGNKTNLIFSFLYLQIKQNDRLRVNEKKYLIKWS